MCWIKVSVLTVLRDLPCAPLEEETNTPASGLDQLDGPGVGHVPGALSVYLDDLVPNLDVRRRFERETEKKLSERKRKRAYFYNPVSVFDVKQIAAVPLRGEEAVGAD